MAEILKRGKVWYFRYTDADGRRRMVRGCSDKRETEGMAAAKEAEAAKIRSRIVNPKEFAYAEHERKPLAEHLEDWHAFLKGTGTAKHADLSVQRVQRLITLAKIDRISDLTISAAQAGLTAIRNGDDKNRPVSLQSVHHYLRAIKGFSRWLWFDKRGPEYGLAPIKSQEPDADRRHERRALTADELARLIQAAADGRPKFNVSGRDRAALYRVACGTGFRANECRSLTPESFALETDPPKITVNAAYSKRRREDAQPIRPDLADALRPWLATKAPGKPVFGTLTTRTAEMLRVDLKAAKIPYRDGAGRVADFHALRHSYVTALAMSSNPVSVVQSLARHSTPELTLGVYTHIGLHDQTTALEALPDLSRPTPTTEALSATGTDGPTHRKTFAPHLIRATDVVDRVETHQGDRGFMLTASSGEDSASGETAEITASDVRLRVETHADAGYHGAPGSVSGAGARHGLQNRCTELRTHIPPSTCDTSESTCAFPDPLTTVSDPDLVVVMHAWGNLAPHVRATIVGIVRASRPEDPATT